MNQHPQRRRSRRISCNLPVRWVRRGGADLHGCTGNISAQGLFIKVPASATPGSLLQLIVDLPTGPITLLVVARFVGQSSIGSGIGLEIFFASEAHTAAWLAHYRQLLAAERPTLPPQSLAVAG